jgi:eukaryotic-like serine/threonine-protein kinase
MLHHEYKITPPEQPEFYRGISMVDFETLQEGVSVDGAYTLEQCIRHDRAGAFFAALTGDGERLLMKLMLDQDPEAERQFATWQRSRHLRHANLLYLRDVGRAELAGIGYIYAVFEYPDDVLAPALEQGPLSEQETRGVLEAVLAGLRYLHGQGLIHGAVDTDHIVAVGEKVKLATDALRESDDLEGHPEDVRQLGELVRSLRAPEPLSEPLATIVRHATAADARQRWTLAEIARVIERMPAVAPVAPAMPPPVPPAVVPTTPAIPEPVSSAVTPVEPTMPGLVSPVVTSVEPSMPEPFKPVVTSVETETSMPERIPPGRDLGDARSPKAFPKWIIAGLAILIFLILIFNLRRKPEAESEIAPVTLAPQVAAAPAAPAPQAANRSVAPPAEITPPSARGIWRVIAFTFRSRDMAAKKAKQIDDKWPDLRAEVFAPKGRRGYYLVALGDGMSREEATRVQRKARSRGLPRDTYVQNYSD